MSHNRDRPGRETRKPKKDPNVKAAEKVAKGSTVTSTFATTSPGQGKTGKR